MEPRAYDALMDDHSLHEVLIRHGTTVDSTPEFESFNRKYLHIWPEIAGLILRLEAICAQYAVPMAVVDGRGLAELAKDTREIYEDEWPMEKLLGCVKNIQEVAVILKQPGR